MAVSASSKEFNSMIDKRYKLMLKELEQLGEDLGNYGFKGSVELVLVTSSANFKLMVDERKKRYEFRRV